MDLEKEKTIGQDEADSGSAKRSRSKRLLRRTAKLLAGTVAVSSAATELVLLLMFGRTKPVMKAAFPLTGWASELGLVWQTVEFLSGESTLRGYIVSPAAPRALIIIAHGMNSSSDVFEPVAKFFAEREFAVFAFDGTASGRSEGDGVVGLQQARYDIRAALSFILESDGYSSLPIVLMGHSAGAYGAATESDTPGVKAVVCVSSFDSPIGTMHHWARTYTSILGDIQLPFLAAHEFVSLGMEANTSASSALSVSRTPAFVAHGASDDAIPLKISLYGKLGDESGGRIDRLLESREGHDSHCDILVKDGEINAPLMNSIYEFLQSVLPAAER